MRVLADLASRRPWAMVTVALALATVAAIFGASTPGRLSSSDDDFQDPASESFRTLRTINRVAGVDPGPSVFVVVRAADAGRTARLLRAERQVAIVQPRAEVSSDGRFVLVTASFNGTDGYSDTVHRLVRTLPGEVGGSSVANVEINSLSQRDLFRAELIAFPLLLLFALWVFRGVVAALLPVCAGGLTIVLTLALLRVVNDVRPLSVFALNLVTGAGLGLAIDYSLLLVSRYREEIARRGPGRDALRATLSTAGRTVAFSAVTVAVAFASLLAFPLGFLRSMALGGMVVAPLAGFVALAVLAPLLALLGPRVNALAPARWQHAAERAARPDEHGGWYRYAHGVMRRPLPIAVLSAIALVALGLPFLGVRFTGIDASVLPKSASARRAQDALRAHLLAGTDAPLHVLVRRADPAATVAGLRRTPGVAAVARPARLGPRLWNIEIIPRRGAMDERTKQLVRDVRRLPDVAVAGRTAWYLDTSSSLRRHLPAALAILALTTFVLLFLVTRSVVLPLKALVMNALGLSAAFGILTLIFGTLDLTQPPLLFAIAFGLSTDYGVFLLARIKEAHDAGLENRDAVALGLERTGRIVTAAALLFCIAVGSFATSSIVIVQQVGIGIALAVAIDATLVRALLVPSLMALLGPWNWWAPPPFRGRTR
jgi:uncharacterized membrane protein YdfJ with MMPL/SSD domain